MSEEGQDHHHSSQHEGHSDRSDRLTPGKLSTQFQPSLRALINSLFYSPISAFNDCFSSVTCWPCTHCFWCCSDNSSNVNIAWYRERMESLDAPPIVQLDGHLLNISCPVTEHEGNLFFCFLNSSSHKKQCRTGRVRIIRPTGNKRLAEVLVFIPSQPTLHADIIPYVAFPMSMSRVMWKYSCWISFHAHCPCKQIQAINDIAFYNQLKQQESILHHLQKS